MVSAGMALGRELVQLNQLGEIDLGKISEPSAHSQGGLIVGWGRQVGLASWGTYPSPGCRSLGWVMVGLATSSQ